METIYHITDKFHADLTFAQSIILNNDNISTMQYNYGTTQHSGGT